MIFFNRVRDFYSICILLNVERRGKRRPSEHPCTGRARPPRCLVRWQCDSPRSLITSRRSAGRDLGRNSAVSLAVSQPFLSRFSTQMDKKLGFEGQKRLNDHRQRRTRRPQHHPRSSTRHFQGGPSSRLFVTTIGAQPQMRTFLIFPR